MSYTAWARQQQIERRTHQDHSVLRQSRTSTAEDNNDKSPPRSSPLPLTTDPTSLPSVSRPPPPPPLLSSPLLIPSTPPPPPPPEVPPYPLESPPAEPPPSPENCWCKDADVPPPGGGMPDIQLSWLVLGEREFHRGNWGDWVSPSVDCGAPAAAAMKLPPAACALTRRTRSRYLAYVEKVELRQCRRVATERSIDELLHWLDGLVAD